MNIYERILQNLRLFHSLRYIGKDLEATEPILLEDDEQDLSVMAESFNEISKNAVEMGGVLIWMK